jgi:hypothetical protein
MTPEAPDADRGQLTAGAISGIMQCFAASARGRPGGEGQDRGLRDLEQLSG